MLGIASASVLVSAAEAVSQLDAPATEGTVKAAFLYKFLSYIDWPAAAFDGPDSPLVMGVLGADQMADELADLVQGRTVGRRRVQVRKLQDRSAVSGSHLLFIGALPTERTVQAIRDAKAAGAVTVTEVPAGLALGSVINFLLVDDRVRFEISREAAEQTRVSVSSGLLGVAYRVQSGRP